MEKRRVYVIRNDEGQELQDGYGDTLVFDSYMEAVQFCLMHSFQLAGCFVVEIED
jgi:hypothetical protein